MYPARRRRRRQQRKRLSSDLLRQLQRAQSTEETEAIVYAQLAKITKDPKNRQVLENISYEEQKHARYWRQHTGQSIGPNRMMIFFYTLVAKFLGLTFSVKLMEKGEERAQVNYQLIAREIPYARKIEAEENQHEAKLLGMLDEERLKYVGSMVLGVNDALVELTGALAGFTLALQNTSLIATIGLITGIAASLSMAASEYLSTKAEADGKDPLKASVYTGIMYFFTVIALITPYYLLTNVYLALIAALTVAILIILLFTFYISVAQDLPFKKRFLEMAGISLGVSGLTFVIGFLVRQFFGIDV